MLVLGQCRRPRRLTKILLRQPEKLALNKTPVKPLHHQHTL